MSTDLDTDTDQSDAETEVVLAISDAALDTVIGVRDAEDDADTLCLRVEITGFSGPEFTYDLAFEPTAGLDPDHRIYTQGDLTVAIPESSVDRLAGATLDLPSSASQGGLVIRNPNRPDPLAGAKLELTGDLPDKVQQLLAEQINPGLASHGGFASLVGVDEEAEGGAKVFLSMGGGCQGCAMSQATMVEGIQTALKEAIPEVAEVVDVTDHAAGDNPFYS